MLLFLFLYQCRVLASGAVGELPLVSSLVSCETKHTHRYLTVPFPYHSWLPFVVLPSVQLRSPPSVSSTLSFRSLHITILCFCFYFPMFLSRKTLSSTLASGCIIGTICARQNPYPTTCFTGSIYLCTHKYIPACLSE